MKKIIILFSLVITSIVLSACNDNPTIVQDMKLYYAFNTSLNVQVYYENDIPEETLDEMWAYVNTTIDTYHNLSDKFNSYEDMININHINSNNEEDKTYKISNELTNLFIKSKDYYEITDNYFNVALNPTIEIWDKYNENCITNEICEVPTDEELEGTRDYIDFDKVIINENTNELFVPKNYSFDFGAITKGYVTELISNYLSKYFEGIFVNAGTSTLKFINGHIENRNWVVGVRDPNGVSTFEKLSLKDTSIGTSGDYENFYTVPDDDTIYHHIISPFTLKPEQFNKSVTVINQDSGLADILSSAVFLMKPNDALDFINSMDNTYALIYTKDSDILYSNGMNDYIHDEEAN